MSYASSQLPEGPWVDIDLGAICANFAMIKRETGGAEVCAVVKCNAYGLGMAPVAEALASREQCRSFFVAYAHEGVALRKAFEQASPDAEIFVFAGPSQETVTSFINSKLTPVLNSAVQAQLWATAAPDIPAAMHFDTGMNRLGAPISDLPSIKGLSNLNLTLIMSHLACAHDPSHPKNQEQAQAFRALADQFPEAKKSLAASGGALMNKNLAFDMVRPGIALYGASPFDVDDSRIQTVAALRAPVAQIRSLAPGETVGYGGDFKANRPTKTATVALGYGDGAHRACASLGAAFINGEHAPIVGRVSMDFITLDVTDCNSSIKTGDTATFWGAEISITQAAKACKTIPYELLTSLGDRVARRYEA